MTPVASSSNGTATPSGRSGSTEAVAKLASLLVSGMLILVLYRTLDVAAVGALLRDVDPGLLAAAIGMILPITLLVATRFLWIAPRGSVSGLGEAVRLTMAAQVLNLFLPSKAGDLVKSYFVAKRGGGSLAGAVAVVVYERLGDLFGLLGWALLAAAFSGPANRLLPPSAWIGLSACGVLSALLTLSNWHKWATQRLEALPLLAKAKAVRILVEGWSDLHATLPARRATIALLSAGLWLMHLTQIWMFALALSLDVPYRLALSLFPLALLAGQLPFTLAGIGARDLALVTLMADRFTPEGAAALGVLITLRGVLPSLVALPILRPYARTLLYDAARWRRG